jgi:hypothetical protein
VIGVMRGIWHGAGRELIGWLRWRRLRRGRRNGLARLVLAEVPPGRRGRGSHGGPPGVDADGMEVAASGTGTHDEHGLERSGAKENGASGKYEERQLRSVSLGHGSRGWCCRIRTKPITPIPAYLSRGLPPTLLLH